jgi:hypothetical protein
MVVAHELVRALRRMQKAPEAASDDFRLARPPRAQSLPLTSPGFGMSRWQLYDEATINFLPACGA